MRYWQLPFMLPIVSFALGTSQRWTRADLQQVAPPCAATIVDIVAKHFKLDDFTFPRNGFYPSVENGGLIVAGVCKVWAADRSKVLAAFAYDAGAQDEKRFLVAVVEVHKQKVVASFDGVLQEDAAMKVGDNSLRLDTAPYDLAPGIRAFGVDLSTSYRQGCVDGGSGPARTLFIQEGERLRPVLSDFYLSEWRFVKGGPSCATSEREPIVENVTFKIGVGKAPPSGYANLRVTATSDLRKKPFRYELRYNGQTYPTSLFNDAVDQWRRRPP